MEDEEVNMRLFLAIQFDESMVRALTEFQEKLRAFGVRGRFPPPENLHLTLAFIGEYAAPEAVMDAASSVTFRPVCLRLDGVGSFGNLYWAGLEKNEALVSYVKKLRGALAARSIPYDRKRFSPHITLVRNAAFQGESQWPQIDPPKGETEAKGVSLMRSDRGKHGMIYTEIGWIGRE